MSRALLKGDVILFSKEIGARNSSSDLGTRIVTNISNSPLEQWIPLVYFVYLGVFCAIFTYRTLKLRRFWPVYSYQMTREVEMRPYSTSKRLPFHLNFKVTSLLLGLMRIINFIMPLIVLGILALRVWKQQQWTVASHFVANCKILQVRIVPLPLFDPRTY